MTFDELVNFTLKALKESIDEEATKENIRVAYIKGEDKKFHMCNAQEVGEFLTKLT
jgi:20S proteasome alpha/beta subunit